MMRPTADRILEAAERSMSRYGVAVSMGDVASEAGVSRGSLYRHFGDRERLVGAVLDRTADRFVASAAAQVDRRQTLSAQFAEAVAYVAETARRLERDGGSGGRVRRRGRRSPLAVVVVERSDRAAERWMAFWEARLEPAEERGELRPDIDRRGAAEWLTRVLVSFAVAPEIEVDPADHRAVRRFVDRNLLRGLAA
jgi:AcrR family transcriptional regulator